MNKDSIAEKRFVQLTLSEEGKDLVLAHKKAINRFLNLETGQTAQRISMQVKASGMGGELQIQHLARQRFLDMKTRQTKNGPKRKHAFPIHNRIIFGHFNSIVGRLKFGFTEEIKRSLQP
jgi:hypothetical protein